MKNLPIIILIFSGTFIFTSCKKYVDPGQPATQLTSSSLFSNDATATAAILAAYTMMEAQATISYWNQNTGLSADELLTRSTSPTYLDIVNNNLTPDNSLVSTHWTHSYSYIYQANAILEGVEKSTTISSVVKKQLEGEAYFLRALFHFYLVNFYGAVPIVKTTDYQVNAVVTRSPVLEVYQIVTEDLEKATTLLSEDYLGGNNLVSNERVRPNRYAALALLARVYLYTSQWQKAEQTASLVISQSAKYQLASNLNNVFLKNDKEQIWQVQPTLPTFNTFTGYNYVTSGATSIPTVYMDGRLAKSFPSGDRRRNNWITYKVVGLDTFYIPEKFKIGFGATSVTEYASVLRLAEQFLIRSEARAMQDNLIGGEADINIIRERAGIPTVSGLSKLALVDSIQLERYRELFVETGDRWFNLKRLNKSTEILQPLKSPHWASTDELYPIPLNEIIRNPLLVQNPGY
jgi:hypothetical protein